MEKQYKFQLWGIPNESGVQLNPVDSSSTVGTVLCTVSWKHNTLNLQATARLILRLLVGRVCWGFLLQIPEMPRVHRGPLPFLTSILLFPLMEYSRCVSTSLQEKEASRAHKKRNCRTPVHSHYFEKNCPTWPLVLPKNASRRRLLPRRKLQLRQSRFRPSRRRKEESRCGNKFSTMLTQLQSNKVADPQRLAERLRPCADSPRKRVRTRMP